MKIVSNEMFCYNPHCMRKHGGGKPVSWFPQQHPDNVKVCTKCKAIYFRDIKPDEEYFKRGLKVPISKYVKPEKKKIKKVFDKDESSLYTKHKG